MEAAREGHEEMVALLLAQGKTCMHVYVKVHITFCDMADEQRPNQGFVHCYRC